MPAGLLYGRFLGFAVELLDAFKKPAEDLQDNADEDRFRHDGQVAVPTMRRERTAAAVASA